MKERILLLIFHELPCTEYFLLVFVSSSFARMKYLATTWLLLRATVKFLEVRYNIWKSIAAVCNKYKNKLRLRWTVEKCLAGSNDLSPFYEKD